MTNKLDASHQCVLKNWETITQMRDCATQVERHLKEFASKICTAFHAKHHGNFKSDDMIEKDGYFSLTPFPLLKWKKSELPLLSFGIENTGVENLLHVGSADPFSAYVYSAYRANKTVTDSSTDKLISIVPPPANFESTFDNPERGYVFQKVIPRITPADFCDPKKLERHIVTPLAALVAWFTTNEKTILKSFGASRRERKPR